MNMHDSERIEEVLIRSGYSKANGVSDADLVLFNTCSVREKAEHKLLSAVGRLRQEKQVRPELVIAVAGCVAQQEGEALLKRSDLIDIVLGPDNIPELPKFVEALKEGAPRISHTIFDLEQPTFLQADPSVRATSLSTFVTVMKGCDERCTFCIVPYTRGSERYRSADAIVQEIQALVAAGTAEVTLLGQTVNSWHEPGADQGELSQFSKLLRRIAQEVPNLRRLRYTSPHPRHVTDALLSAHRDIEVLAEHVHLPLQSGSDRVLRRMLRRYSREKFLSAASALKATRPGLTLSTDIIVGFPGETEADFQKTLEVVKEAAFSSAFLFKYSKRPGTPALKLEGEVEPKVVEERFERLLRLTEAQQQQHLKSLVGTEQRVLIEGASRSGQGQVFGRTKRNEIVHVQAGSAVLGGSAVPGGSSEVPVRVLRANRHSLLGQVLPGAVPSGVHASDVLPTHVPSGEGLSGQGSSGAQFSMSPVPAGPETEVAAKAVKRRHLPILDSAVA